MKNWAIVFVVIVLTGCIKTDHLVPIENPNDWPVLDGGIQVAKWKGAKEAAVSITIDDNHLEDHSFWRQRSAQYGWKFTWFVITGWADQNGEWSAFSTLKQEGHEIASHTVSHLADTSYSISYEYGHSQDIFDLRLGHRPLTLAYPYGLEASNRNSRDTAKMHYLFARGTKGIINQVGNIDYYNINGISKSNGKEPWASIETLLNTSHANYGGWHVSFFHGIQSFPERVDTLLSVIDRNRNNLWVGTFDQVGKYARLYESATIVKLKSGDNSSNLSFAIAANLPNNLRKWYSDDQEITIIYRVDTSLKGKKIRIHQGNVQLPVNKVVNGGVEFLVFNPLVFGKNIYLTVY